MALRALTSTSLTHPVSFPKTRLYPHNLARNYQTSISCSIKFPITNQFNSSELKTQLNHVKGKIFEIIPDSVKKFPLKKAENIAIHQLLITGQHALKWSLFAAFIFNFLSDFMYSVSINKELVIPFGLIFGCLIGGLLNETFREYLDISKVKNMVLYLLGISSVFMVMKSVSVYFPVNGRVFMLHGSNGLLMQVLWDLVSDNQEKNEIENAQVVKNGED